MPGYDGIESCKAARMTRGGRVDLAFTRDPGGRTFLARQYAGYPFHLCRPHRFVGDPPGMATVYIQSVAGGIFEGDRLQTALAVEAGAQAHVTTQASTIVHGMERDHAKQAVTIEAADGAFVEYLPDATILFPTAKLESRVRVRAHDTATVLIADSFLVHDPGGCGATFDWLVNDTAVATADGTVIARDRFRVTGDLLAQALPGLNGRFIAQGSVMVIRRNAPLAPLLDAVRGALDLAAGVYAGAATMPGDCGVWARILAADGDSLRRAIIGVWSSARLHLTGVAPAVRRK